jgi:2'-5' RNA ligase
MPIRDALLEVATGVPGAYWAEEDQLHLTLRFLGDIDGVRRTQLVQALERLEAETFELQLQGIGFFPPRGEPESLWIGVVRNPALDALQTRVDAIATRLGIERDRKRWTPHVTLARLDGAPESRLVRFATEQALFRTPVFRPEVMTLFSSHRRDWGSEYRREAVFPLRPPATARSA